MKVLYVTGGPVSLSLIRSLSFRQGSQQIPVMDEVNGPREYRSWGFSSGIAVVEDALVAASLLDLAPANATFSVKTATSVGTITVIGFKAIEMMGEVTDGAQGGKVVGYAVAFTGEPGQASPGAAITHAQS